MLLIASLPQVLSILEISAVLFALVYLFYASRQNPLAWIHGCISAILSFFFFWKSNLHGSAFLQLFYFLQGVMGYLNWTVFEPKRQASYRYSVKYHIVSLFILITVIGITYFVLAHQSLIKDYEPNVYDISLAIGSVWATQLESKKDIACWWYWIICNLGFAILYIYSCFKGEAMYVYAGLMLFYAFFSFLAKRKWERDLSHKNESDANANENESRHLVDQF